MPHDLKEIVSIDSESDIVSVRKAVRGAAVEIGFGKTDVTRIVTAASELARNIFHYAGAGVMQLLQKNANNIAGIELVFVDKGPGITDVQEAMQMGFTTRKGLGLGLPGAKRLMDEMEIRSKVGQGTTVMVRKWMKR